MPRYAANLTMLFTEVPSLDRPGLASQAGFDGVEILFPYDHAAKDWQSALGQMPLAMINTPPGDWAAGDRGHAAVPGLESRFRDGFLRAADLATRLGADRVHVMAGVARGPEATQLYTGHLAWAAAQAPDLTLCIEPLNAEDMPGYFLNDFDQAARILEDVGSPASGCSSTCGTPPASMATPGRCGKSTRPLSTTSRSPDFPAGPSRVAAGSI